MNIAIVGATGLVGREVIKILEEKDLVDGNNITLFASSKSAGKTININGNCHRVKELCNKNINDRFDFAIFTAGSEVSLKWANKFVKNGAWVIDNSSAFRRTKGVPLVVPEINFMPIQKAKIIANPNCSTIGASIPIKILDDLFGVKRIIISTYQAVSGAGQTGVEDLKNGTTNKFKYNIKDNLIPQIDKEINNGYTFEEDKMDFELKKILNNKNLKISATCVRVPITNCHSESVNVECKKEPSVELFKQKICNTKGIKLVDDLKNGQYPMPSLANGGNDILIGRIRKDTSNKNSINFFICFDNLRKGAALNAVQIMEYLIRLKQN